MNVSQRLSEYFRFHASALNKSVFNTSTIRRRHFDAQIVSMHNSGSHWLKYSLGVGIAEVYGLESPEHIQSDRIVGHPKSLPDKVPGLPCIVHSHSLAHKFQSLSVLYKIMDFPKYIVLVRNIEDALFSTYVKWSAQYPGVSFREFIHSGAFGNGKIGGLWHEINFYNTWGAVEKAYKEGCMIVRYEDLRKDWQHEFLRVWEFIGLTPISEEQLQRVRFLTSKDEMAKKPNPEVQITVVRQDGAQVTDHLSEDDRQFIQQQCRRYLRYDLGYSSAL
jgi:hypothetical protein